MNGKVTFFLIFSSIVFLNKAMQEGEFEQRCDAAHTKYTWQEQQKVEREREKNRDIEGYTKTNLQALNFLLRIKDAQDPLMLDYYNNIEVYQKEGEEISYIDLHVRKVELVHDIINQQIERSENLAEVMQRSGFFDLFEGTSLDLLSQIFNNCTINPQTKKFNTTNLLYGTSLTQIKSTSLFEKLCYAGGGFAFALPICYISLWYFKANK